MIFFKTEKPHHFAIRQIRRAANHVLPNHFLGNYPLAAHLFWIYHHRLPRAPDAANADINDFMFDRMVRNRWSGLHRAAVDKEFSKEVAQRLANVRVARTVAILQVTGKTTLADLESWIAPFAGKRMVMKPTHGSGNVVFLDQPMDQPMLGQFLRNCQTDHFHACRESQYQGLPKKIIIENRIGGDALNDWKFFCAFGQVFVCQVDTGRFTDHRRALVDIPAQQILPVQWHKFAAPENIQLPANLDAMVAVAAALSKPFEFVRVDLYDTAEGIFFGEYTFAPGAGLEKISDVAFGVRLLNQVRAAAQTRDAATGVAAAAAPLRRAG